MTSSELVGIILEALSNMITRLLLVRHAQIVDNLDSRFTGWLDAGLTPRGLSEARQLARFIEQNYRVDVLYSSPLHRALATAKIIEDRVGLEPIIVEELKEINFGDVEGLTKADIEVRFPDLFVKGWDPQNPNFKWPNGESRYEFRTRVRRAIEDITNANRGRTILIVSHGAAVSSYLCHLLDPDANRWSKYWVDNCGLTELELGEDSVRLVRHNDRSFFAIAPDGKVSTTKAIETETPSNIKQE